MANPLDQLYALIDDIEIAMMTTRRPDGHLRSRAMATQRPAAGADLWFVTSQGCAKLAELAQDPHVNLAYHRDSNHEWVSVSGTAAISTDRAKIRELYAPDWKMWFGSEGDPRHGTPEDPRVVLIGVTVHAAEFLDVTKPQPMVLFEMAKGWLTGTPAEIGDMHRLDAPHRPA